MSSPDLATIQLEAIEAVRGRTVPGTVRMLAFAGIAWGLAAMGYGLFVGDAAWTWGALLVGIVYFLAVSQGGFMFAVIMQGTRARWGRPLKRIGEAMAVFNVVVLLALIVFLAGGLGVYAWNPAYMLGEPIALEPHGTAPSVKPWWLTPAFFSARTVGLLSLMLLLDLVFLRNSLRPDLIKAKAVLGADAPAWWDRIIGGGTDVDAAYAAAENANNRLVPVLAMGYALIFSMLTFDLIMSLDPWWYSNMFGAWQGMSAVLIGLCMIATISMVGRDWLSLGHIVTPTVTLDLGKLMLAGTMFWAYTLFAQILPITYTNVHEETNFLLVRMMLPQWSWLARLVAVLCFVAPFTILLSRGIKKMRYPFVGIAMLILVGQFLERTLLVMPSVYLGETFPWMDFVVVNLGVLAGFSGLFALVVLRFLARVPAIPVANPFLEDHPWDVHVHALGAHGHH